MTTFRFTGPSTSRKHAGTCPGCGKKVARSRKFEHTVNPFNKNPDGSVRTWEQVDQRVQAEADSWVPDFRCSNCEFSAWVAGLTVAELESEIRGERLEATYFRRVGKEGRARCCDERAVAFNARLRELQDAQEESP